MKKQVFFIMGFLMIVGFVALNLTVNSNLKTNQSDSWLSISQLQAFAQTYEYDEVTDEEDNEEDQDNGRCKVKILASNGNFLVRNAKKMFLSPNCKDKCYVTCILRGKIDFPEWPFKIK